MECVRDEHEIARVEGWATSIIDDKSYFPSLSYEQGVLDTILWLRGELSNAPDDRLVRS